MQFVSVCEAVCLCVCVYVCLCVCVSVSQKHRHTDTQPHRQTQIALQSITNFYLCIENPSFKEEKKLYTKTLFAPNFVVEMVVSEKVLERQFQGHFESGPKSWTYNLKTRANYAEMYLKIHHFH